MSAYKIMMLTLVAAIGIVAIRTRLNESKPKDHAAAKEKEEKDADPDSDRAGKAAVLKTSFFCAPSEYVFAQVIEAISTKDDEMGEALIARHRVRRLRKGTRVSYIIRGETEVLASVIIRSGAYVGESCWLPIEILSFEEVVQKR